MSTRYFEIRAPRADFTGHIGTIAFADGVARVSFDDTRDESGQVLADQHRVQTGRSAVLFARRRTGYTVTEVDAAGNPVDADEPKQRGSAGKQPAAKSGPQKATPGNTAPALAAVPPVSTPFSGAGDEVKKEAK